MVEAWIGEVEVMSVPLRYQHPSVVAHLASGYVLGGQSHRVRKRCRALSQRLPVLAKAIIEWEERLQPLAAGPSVLPSASVWSGIEQRLWHQKGLHAQLRWWRSLTALAATLLLLVSVWWWQAPTLPSGPHYVAALQDRTSSELWVVKVTRLKVGEVRLNIEGEQWGEQPLVLWAEGGEGNWVMLGKPSRSNREWALDKARWLAVARATRLVLTTSVEQTPEQSNWLYEGPCLQLREWL
jgi:anti-sigma-K factor RskA